MKTAVRYHSRGGNTKKLAQAAAKAAGTEAKDIKAGLDEKVDVLFLGSSVYAGRPDEEVAAFIQRYADKIGRIVCFGSSASGKSTRGKIAMIAGDYNVPVAEEFFNCPGKFLFMHRDRPGENDFAALAAFVGKIIAG